jgi:type II secretory pathway predicted ATPase ExeA
MNKNMLSPYGLKWNPFSPDLPTEALFSTPRIESFLFRIEQTHLREGGFALVTGDPGMGKSVVMRLLAERLAKAPGVTVGAIAHPQCNVADFYREMGDLFGVPLKPHNRWNGFKALRERWLAHIESTLARPVLLIDEVQEMTIPVLCEMRLLSSMKFDSRILLSVVLAGDGRFVEKLRRDELAPLGSRIRARLVLEAATSEDLLACLKHLLAGAGNPSLMTKELQATLADHAMGNYRVLTTMAGDLLAAAAEREQIQLDEKLFLEVFGGPRKAGGAISAAPMRAGRRS